MSKNKRLLLILLAIAAVLAAGVAVILLTAPDDTVSSDEPSETALIYSVTRDEFVSASVSNEAGGFTLVKTADGYTVKEDEGFETNAYSTSWVGDKLLAPNASRTVASPGALSEYGLDSPAATCRVELADGSAKTLLLGNEAPSGGRYMSLQGEDGVYIVTHNLPLYLTRSAASYVETDVIPSKDDFPEGTDTNVKYVFIGGKKRAENVEIIMDPNYVSDETASTPYVMTQPIDYPVNSTTTGDLVTYASGMSFTECVEIRPTPERVAFYGLDDPDYTLVFRFADKEVRIGFADAGEFCYAKMDGFDAVFTAYPTYTSFLSNPADTYMSRLTFTKPLSALSGLTVNYAGGAHVFKVDRDGGGIIPSCGGLKLDADNFKLFYENLIMTLSEGRLDSVPAAPAALTLTYSFNDGSADVKVEFVPVDNMRYAYLIDGEGVFFVLKSQVDAIISDAALVAQNKPIKSTI